MNLNRRDFIVVPAATAAFSTSPTATLAPSVPAAPVVSTAAGSSARAGEAEVATTSSAANSAPIKRLVMWFSWGDNRER